VLGYYALDLVMSLIFMRVGGPGAIVVRPIIAALLLSNLRATWIASKWEPSSENAALPPRFAETLSDKFVDQWPAWIWPKVRIVYYILSLLLLLLAVVGVASLLLRPFAKF
jgi:hypothetical protein